MEPRQTAFERGIKSISVRERTASEVAAFLRHRDYEPDVIDDVVRALQDEGLVDDAGYARRFAEDRRLLDRWGNERIARDLVRRGVERELIDQALAGHGRDEEMAVAVELLDRRFPLPFEGDRDRDKAWRVLVPRGYEAELAYQAVRQHEQSFRRAA